MEKARRYNKGKLRYELISQEGLKEVAKVYTLGAEKYTLYNNDGSIKEDGANNWRKGMPWMDTIASVKRHIADWENCEDFDELGTKHLANAAWGLLTLLDYYKSYPQGDDRPHTYLKKPRIALDIDDVLASWIKPWSELHGHPQPTSWQFDRAIAEKFETMARGEQLNDFYSNLPVLTSPADIPFEPVMYVTARPVDSRVTEEWLDKYGFPAAPVCTVGIGNSKVECLKANNIDIFVDDNFNNFVELNKAGICTFLFDAPHNSRYQVGYKRLYSLKELV